ncbi:unnamed protein product [Rotaria sp. Silwood1]|nr:unnamed protein product [Rotaria sp. Silwood1]CAF3694067.1 unnamed protein product [Rotaria sp. Silwood1]CAF3745187.1 unnamed protein product [Rotaria sp. Silwood1]CAF4855104.1 unnamed protein product [Rotaria sp. Silwood1]
MRKAWKLLKIIHMFCIGHGIHNLLMVDCFPRLTGVPDLLDKVQKIINKLRYRQHELEQEFIQIHDQIKNDLFEVINKAGEVLDADLALSYDDIEDVDQLDNEKENYELELYSINDQRSSKFDYLKKTNTTTNNSYEFHTLKKRVVTRWNTILIMLRSYESNIPGIEIILRRLKLFHLILTPTENEVVRDLVDFLSSFETTTTILSASKSYPTMSLCLLLRIEIESMLHSTGTESSVIEELKHLFSEYLDTRFPITPLNICGFLLDPSQLKFDINRYLTQNKTTKEKLLLDMIKKFKIDHASHANTIQNIHKSSMSSSATTSETSSPRMKRNLSVEYMCESAHNMKKLRDNLIQKHTPLLIISLDPIVAEIDSYIKLAQIILGIPVTSTPSEEVFSTTGLILNAKRTALAPENVGKIQMIHDNYELLKKN